MWIVKQMKIRKMAKILANNNSNLKYDILVKHLQDDIFYKLAKDVLDGRDSIIQNYFIKYSYYKLIEGYNNI